MVVPAATATAHPTNHPPLPTVAKRAAQSKAAATSPTDSASAMTSWL